jgi:hypothetical protein
MKKIGMFILLVALMLQGLSQEVISNEKQDEKKLSAGQSDAEKTRVIIGDNLFRYEEDSDGVRLRIGDRGLSILESLETGKPRVNFEKYDTPEVPEPVFVQDEDPDERRARNRSRFKGHWSGFEFGFNNYLTADNSLTLPDDIYYMSLHSSKSNSFNLNFVQNSFGFARRFGIVTGLGINWNNYRFDGNNNILKGINGIVEELDPGAPLEKSKLTTVYMTMPVMLELQIPADNNHINIAAGFIGAIKLGSHTKMVFEDGDKVKSNGDFSLNLLRYGPTARIGFENWQIYATYYMTPLFKEGKGPGGHDLYPFEIGFSFTFND